MKQSEAEALVVKMKQLWGNPFKVTSTTSVEWAQHAQHVTYEQMDKAIDHFAAMGDKFPPSLAEVVSRAKAGAAPVGIILIAICVSATTAEARISVGKIATN